MKAEFSEELPLLVLSNLVIFPKSSRSVNLKATRNLAVVEECLQILTSGKTCKVLVGYASNSRKNNVGLSPTGTLASVTGIVQHNQTVSIRLYGLHRVALGDIVQAEPFPIQKYTQLDRFDSGHSVGELDETSGHKIRVLKILMEQAFGARSSRLRQLEALNSGSHEDFIDILANYIEATYAEKLEILECLDLEARIEKTMKLLVRMNERRRENEGGVRVRVGIRPDELFSNLVRNPGSPPKDSGERNELSDLKQRIRDCEMPEDTMEMCLKEAERLASMGFGSPESSSLRNYLDLMVSLPWKESSDDRLNVNMAKEQLEKDHFGLEDVKKRILEFLAVRQLKNSMKGPLICLVGPPGVGKTSIAVSIAKSMQRKFERISLGGVSDQSDIRGHRRTYVASMPGRIINAIKHANTNNPVILLDEVDKMKSGLHGDPAAALLEVLDPEQNNSFTDHYLNVPFDLSNVFFIATANTVETIPPALFDRMEVIKLPGYTLDEKLEIGKKYLIPKQMETHGVKTEQIEWKDDGLKFIAQRYTREAGVRSLERKIGSVCRSIALTLLQTPSVQPSPTLLDPSTAEKILGPPNFDSSSRELLIRPGVAAGLVWTPFGGEVLYVETAKVSGVDGELTLTGQLGEVLQESAKVALTWLRSSPFSVAFESEELWRKDLSIHIHFPAGGVSKDGPSAGVTVLAALASLFSGTTLRSDTAMTGEITLRGAVLPVGGVKEKVLAAHAAGFKRVLLPKKNENDLHGVADRVKKEMSFIFLERLEDVLRYAMDDEPNPNDGSPRLKSML